MSLIAWFPLTGNLKNQGIDGTITASATGATVSNAGKIGRCYHMTTAQRLTFNNVPYESLTHASISIWIKVASNENNFLVVTGQDSSATNLYVLASDSGTGNLRNSVAGGAGTIYVDGTQKLAPGTRGQWHHYCVTDVDLSNWTCMYINYYAKSTTNGWNFTGDVNDFRIYDHILSAREVHEISKGLFVHYKLDYIAANSTIDDCSGYMHTAAITGTVYNETNPPKYSSAIRIADGRTNYLKSEPVYFPTDRITLSCWVKGPQTAGYNSYDIILGIGGSTRAYEISLYDTTGIFRSGLVVAGTRSVLNTNPVLDNTWHMLTTTYNGSAIKRYIDGVEVNSTSVSGVLNNGPYAIYIGRFDGDDGYAINNVRISDVRIYSTALSATDVFELYHTGAWIDNLADQFSYELIETSENIFTSENLMKYRHNTTAGGYGEWVERNGENAIAVSPARFYTSSSKVYANILADEFKENTQYIFDMYIDMDGVVSSGVNREGGFTIYYTDGTSNVSALRFTSTGNMGFVHKRYITPANKSVSHLRAYYYAGASVFYKFGSTITEYKSPAVSIKKTGVLETGEVKEDYERVNASYVNGGLLETREKYEF